MQPDHAMSGPLVFVRHNWRPLFVTAVIGGTGGYELANSSLVGLVWLGALAVYLVLEWLHTRLGSRLDRSSSNDLKAALEPVRGPVVDRSTDDVLRVIHRRVLGLRMWQVERYPNARRIMAEVEEDFAVGRVSTIPCTVYLITRRQISAHHQVVPVCVGDGGMPQPYQPPGSRRQLRDTWMRIRVGAYRIDQQIVVDLAAQLRRAEPLAEGPEEVLDAA